MIVQKLLGLATVVAFFSACGDTPTQPVPADPGLMAAASAPSNGAPVVDHFEQSASSDVPCMTFMMNISVDTRAVSQSWFYMSGVIQRSKLHVNQNATFTNLSSGLSLTNNSRHNIETLFDENGLPTEQVINGAQQRIQAFDRGRSLYYHIGHQVVTVDYSTMPPTVDMTFDGHSNAGVVSGPCEALGDPV
jgi:hypothetical protein